MACASSPDRAFAVAEAIHATRRYGATVALDDVSLRVLPGESHALVGRNGAGKSTLVAAFTGLYRLDGGEIRFNGQRAPPLAERRAWRERVACVYQHPTIIRELSVAENLFINRQPARHGVIPGVIDWRALRRNARALLDQWKIDVREDARAGELGVEARQLVEIARAVVRRALHHPGRADRAARWRRNPAAFHAHRSIAARRRDLSVHLASPAGSVRNLPAGHGAARCAAHRQRARGGAAARAADRSDDRRARRAGGGRHPPSAPCRRRPDRARRDGAGRRRLRRGEVVGLSGATSSGRTGVAEALAGLRAPRRGAIRMNGAPLAYGDVRAALASGIGCVPKDRHREGLVLTQSVAENAAMTLMRALGRFGLAPPAAKNAFGQKMIDALGIKAQGPAQKVAGLSGGNQQKVVMARALATDPSLLVLIDPSAGVDVKSKQALLAVVARLREEGRAVLIASGELDDLRACDRVLVMFRGEIVAEFPAGWQDHALIAAIEGVSVHEA